jgi:hypothetical protein
MSFILSVKQTQILAKYLDKIMDQAADGPEWFQEDAKLYVAPLILQYVNGVNKFKLTIDDIEAIGALAQDIVSFRAGPCDEDEEVFFNILNLVD